MKLEPGIDMTEFKVYLDSCPLSPKTKENYLQILKRFYKLYDKITNENLNDFFIKFVHKKRCYDYFYGMKKFIIFRYPPTEQKELLKGLYPGRLKTIKIHRLYLSVEQRKQLLLNIEEPRHQIIALMQYLTGGRIGDVLKIKRGWITKVENQLIIHMICKGDKTRKVYITNKDYVNIIWTWLQDNIYDSGYCFMDIKKSKNGVILGKTDEYNMVRHNYYYYWVDLKEALHSIGIDYKLYATHDWRRCFANDVYSSTKDLLQLQSLLGHDVCSTTARYISNTGLVAKDTLEAYQQGL